MLPCLPLCKYKPHLAGHRVAAGWQLVPLRILTAADSHVLGAYRINCCQLGSGPVKDRPKSSYRAAGNYQVTYCPVTGGKALAAGAEKQALK